MHRLVLVLVATVLWAVATPAVALAHFGPLTLTVAGDGATGITVTAVHTDGHPLDVIVSMELTATGSNGRTVGPVTLRPAGEGMGFYSSGPLLTPGRWQVKVTAPEPTPGTAEVTVDAQAPAPGATTPATPPAAAPPSDPGLSTTTALWAAAALTLTTLLIAYLSLRRRPR